MHIRPRLTLVGALPTCNVCSKEMDPKFLRDWNDQKVCRHCISDLTVDYPEGGDEEHDRKAKTRSGRQSRQGAVGR